MAAWRFGAIEVTRLVEMERPLAPASELFPALDPARLEASRAELRAQGALAEGDLAVLSVQSFLVRRGRDVVLVDTAVGNDKSRPDFPAWDKKQDTRFMDALAGAGVTPEQVSHVVLTHLHSDHVGWNTKLVEGRWVPTFPNARYVIARAEYEYWAAAQERSPVAAFADSVAPVVEAGGVDLVADDHRLGDLLRLTPTPGHSPGHCSVVLGEGEAIIAGDVTHSPLQAVAPELCPIFDMDPQRATATRRAFFEHVAESGAVFIPTHYPSPSAGRLARDGAAFRWRPVETVAG